MKNCSCGLITETTRSSLQVLSNVSMLPNVLADKVLTSEEARLITLLVLFLRMKNKTAPSLHTHAIEGIFTATIPYTEYARDGAIIQTILNLQNIEKIHQQEQLELENNDLSTLTSQFSGEIPTHCLFTRTDSLKGFGTGLGIDSMRDILEGKKTGQRIAKLTTVTHTYVMLELMLAFHGKWRSTLSKMKASWLTVASKSADGGYPTIIIPRTGNPLFTFVKEIPKTKGVSGVVVFATANSY